MMKVDRLIHHELVNVESNEEISREIYETVFKSDVISSSSLPGQFINILPNSNWDKVMRRPMSIASQGSGKISIIYKAIGDGTHVMANWKRGDEVDIIGPLGNYWCEYETTFPILIGGGVGIAPILNLHHLLIENNIDHVLIMGARTKEEHFLKHEPKQNIYMSTDDGRLGLKGNVIDAIQSIYENKNLPENAKIFSCGPPLMMESVRSYAIDNQLACDLALETIMACGFGICQGCTVIKKFDDQIEHSYRNHFALACMDGPIFNANEIATCR